MTGIVILISITTAVPFVDNAPHSDLYHTKLKQCKLRSDSAEVLNGTESPSSVLDFIFALHETYGI